jgi:hypothetical protein
VPNRQVVLLEQLGRDAALDEVELVDQQHIRAGPLHDLRDRLRLYVARRGQIGHQRAGRAAVQRRVERGEPDRGPIGRVGADRRGRDGGQRR